MLLNDILYTFRVFITLSTANKKEIVSKTKPLQFGEQIIFVSLAKKRALC